MQLSGIELKQALTQLSGVKVELPAGSSRPGWSWSSLHSPFPYMELKATELKQAAQAIPK